MLLSAFRVLTFVIRFCVVVRGPDDFSYTVRTAYAVAFNPYRSSILICCIECVGTSLDLCYSGLSRCPIYRCTTRKLCAYVGHLLVGHILMNEAIMVQPSIGRGAGGGTGDGCRNESFSYPWARAT